MSATDTAAGKAAPTWARMLLLAAGALAVAAQEWRLLLGVVLLSLLLAIWRPALLHALVSGPMPLAGLGLFLLAILIRPLPLQLLHAASAVLLVLSIALLVTARRR